MENWILTIACFIGIGILVASVFFMTLQTTIFVVKEFRGDND